MPLPQCERVATPLIILTIGAARRRAQRSLCVWSIIRTIVRPEPARRSSRSRANGAITFVAVHQGVGQQPLDPLGAHVQPPRPARQRRRQVDQIGTAHRQHGRHQQRQLLSLRLALPVLRCLGKRPFRSAEIASLSRSIPPIPLSAPINGGSLESPLDSPGPRKLIRGAPRVGTRLYGPGLIRYAGRLSVLRRSEPESTLLRRGNT